MNAKSIVITKVESGWRIVVEREDGVFTATTIGPISSALQYAGDAMHGREPCGLIHKDY